ncbi:flavin reductase family protein [Luteimicrobium subarcticum]|uniref:Flavin reductase (DIM6/NTAB) family NADH-FMN oxidoreductase RutF n=1 Tax=Luteimicrobium subarcticum TaxID=620910 RepID=A0A2M8WWE6_9MICO|nr:flavin reductase family protein [Luteimicrobium subarcticum]PJI95252.1 flavin reductase (DIM6/NTAB) family NADH-FMN oxidoreductase RutF [Luteimicrobium subarcticum]
MDPTLTPRPRPVRAAADPHDVIDPAILYFGTPVALLSTVDADGRANLAPMSSVFWLGSTALLGLGARSQTALNIAATGEVVINLPSSSQVDAVDRLALTTGRDPVPPRKHAVGYRHVADKFARAHLTPLPSDRVVPARAAECPVQMEARLTSTHPLERDDAHEAGTIVAFEVAVVRTHVHRAIRAPGTSHRVDPARWRPLIMSFQRFYGLGGELRPSRLAGIDEEWYR